ncbi:MAG: hypothetical protein AAF752_05575, partial [Bacteroidota bacterium]
PHRSTNRFLPIIGLGHDFAVASPFEKCADPSSEGGMIIGNDEAYGHESYGKGEGLEHMLDARSAV